MRCGGTGKRGLKGEHERIYFVSTVVSYNLFSNVYDIFCVCLDIADEMSS
jgi:hypothetical protein